MKLYILISSFVLSLTFSNAQNLVPNYSFENYTSCPTYEGQLNNAYPWIHPSNLGFGYFADLFNECNVFTQSVPNNFSGYQNANTGLGYAGIFTYGRNSEREYLQTQLTSALIAGVVYRVEMYVSPSEHFGIGIDEIGMYISNNPISGTGNLNPLPYIPQIKNPTNNLILDTVGWTLISGYYTALGGEDYITIGNFSDDSSTNSLIFNPSALPRGYYRIDDVVISSLTGLESLQNNNNISIYPNPFTSQTTLRTENVFNDATITIYNMFGQIVKELKGISGQTITLNRDNLSNGMYFVKLIEENKITSLARTVIID
jgi:hypothetical protein